MKYVKKDAEINELCRPGRLLGEVRQARGKLEAKGRDSGIEKISSSVSGFAPDGALGCGAEKKITHVWWGKKTDGELTNEL